MGFRHIYWVFLGFSLSFWFRARSNKRIMLIFLPYYKMLSSDKNLIKSWYLITMWDIDFCECGVSAQGAEQRLSFPNYVVTFLPSFHFSTSSCSCSFFPSPISSSLFCSCFFAKSPLNYPLSLLPLSVFLLNLSACSWQSSLVHTKL